MNFNTILEELDKLYEEEKVDKTEQAEDEIKKEPVEEDCAKKALKEADEEEIEFAEEPVDVIPEEEEVEEAADEEIPEEDVDTVKDFAKSLDEYDDKLKLEFKPIIIDGKEYPVTGIMWDDSEEGKLVAEVILDMSEEESTEDADVVEEEEIEFAEEPVETLPEELDETEDEESLEEGLFSEELTVPQDLRQFLNSNKEVAGLYTIFEPARRLLYDEQDYDIFDPKRGSLYEETKETLDTKGSKLPSTKKFYLEKILKVADLGKKILNSKSQDKIKFKSPKLNSAYILVIPKLPKELYSDVSSWMHNLKEVCKHLKVIK